MVMTGKSHFNYDIIAPQHAVFFRFSRLFIVSDQEVYIFEVTETNFSQTYNEGGLWHSDANNFPRRHFFTLEALVSRFKNPEESLR